MSELRRMAATLAMILTVLWCWPALVRAFPTVLGAFNPSPVAWDSAFEDDPDNTDSPTQGDDHLRQIKVELSNRIETEMDFGEFDNVTTDTGRLLEGAARVFVQDSEPPTGGSVNCLTEADYDGNRHCDEGRLWVDSDDGYRVYVCQDDDSDGDCDDWEPVDAEVTVPQNGIILWDNSNSCPSGYSEATEFRNLKVVGADRGSGDGAIPDSAGVSCTGSSLGSGCGASGGTDNYDNDVDTDEFEAHSHSYQTYRSSTSGGATGIDVWFEVGQPADGGNRSTANAGGGESHYHPFRAVLFCRKD